MSKSPILFSSDDEDEGQCQEAELLKKFQKMLQGVPPPSSVTVSKLSVADMLEKYKENENLYGISFQELNVSNGVNLRKNSAPLMIYSNLSKTSEEIANLFQKVQSRYVYLETMSSCNIWFDTVVKANSAKKRTNRRRGVGLSPGSRLSHLAQRRQIFSCENLQQLANSDKRRLIEIKKENTLKTKTLERNKTVEPEKVNTFKRALFLSPDDEDTKKWNLSSNSIKRNLFPSSNRAKPVQDSSKTVEVSKQFFSQNHLEGSAKKRRRMESKDSNGSWPRRALTFSEEEADKNQEANMSNAKVISEVQLSLHHKSKLLWAVSVTLKEKKISSKDPQFKTCASALFMICRKNLGKILSSKREGGTSEKMLHFAREQIGGIFKKLGISSDSNLEGETPDSSVAANSTSSDSCCDHTKENLDSCREAFWSIENFNKNANSELALSIRTSGNQTNEKENIDVSESRNSV